MKVLIIGHQWPEPNSSAAGSRMLQLIQVFLEAGWNCHFACAARSSEYAADLKRIGVETHDIELNQSSFDHFIEQLKPDMVLFDRFMVEEQFGWRVARVCPNALRILDSEDLHFLRYAREEAVKKSMDLESLDLHTDRAIREIAAIYRCDMTLIISNYEIALLRDDFGIAERQLMYVPFMVEPKDKKAITLLPSFEDRAEFVSIGNFLHAPNRDAVLFLKQEIWPLIRATLPKAEMHIYGAYTDESVRQLHNEKMGFLIKGRAEDANKVIAQSRVMLAPLRFGAGLKGKLIEAMQAGTPSVTTSVGAEAMFSGASWCGSIQNEPQQFAQQATELYGDEGKWTQAQQRGFKIISAEFDRERFRGVIIDRLNDLRLNIAAYRRKNFIGAMLQHHSMRSTEFMSRWIELKNR